MPKSTALRVGVGDWAYALMGWTPPVTSDERPPFVRKASRPYFSATSTSTLAPRVIVLNTGE
jgi:hypothetical protein